jgi:NTP pyrophosphatase (non-canonical NTP hydrolase)
MAVAVEAGELMDHFRWVRNEASHAALDDPRTRAEVEEEVGDVMILLLEFAAVCGIDVTKAVEAKLARNAEKYPVHLAKGSAAKSGRWGTQG